MNKHPSSETEQQEFKDNKPNFWHILLSTFAAAFGVQNRKNLEKDFKHGSIKVYIIAGVLFTALFVLLVMIAVNIVLKNNGL
ncbi:MAG: hypothetical protein ACJAUP_001128 [Cellvibrionaceae bacterium]|jgi:hypothetical protein